MWSAASLPATGWRTAICCCARARRTTPCSAAEGNDVHRPLRAGTGGETHRAAHLARHPVPGAEPGGPAVARVPAPRVGAGPRHRRGESLPHAHVRRLSHLAQPANADRLGDPARRAVPVAQRRRSRGDGRRTARREPLGARLRHARSEEHTSELQSRLHLVCRLLLEKKKKKKNTKKETKVQT